MPKATHSTAARTSKKKPAATRAKATVRKPAAKKPAMKKTVAKKSPVKKLIKKVAAKKPAATRTKVPAKANKPVATVKSRAVKSAAKSTTRAAKVAAPARARRAKSTVLEVSPAVIDTTSAAEVAARLVVDAHGPVPVVPSPLGNLSKALSANLFDPPPVVAVKRGSSALRHVKEHLNKPVARQLESVFGPAPVPAETMRRFLKGQKTAKGQRVQANTSTHFGPSNVPHRPVGGGGSRSGE